MNSLIKTFRNCTLLLGAIALFSLPSCGNKKWPEEAAKLDSLSRLLEGSFMELSNIDSAFVETAYQTIMISLDSVDRTLKDSISQQDAELLSNYRGIRKPLKKFNQKRASLQPEYALTIQQLSTLSEDLEKGLLEENKSYEFFVIESSAANKLLAEITELSNSIQIVIEKYTDMKPEVDEFINEMSEAISEPKMKIKSK